MDSMGELMAADILAEAAKSIERVQTFDTAQLPRRDELGSSLAFDAAVAPADRAIRLFQQIPIEHLSDLTDQYLTEIKNQANAFYNLLNSILAFTADGDPNPSSTRTNLIQQITAIYDQLFSAVHPLVGYLVSRQRDFAALEREARAAVQSATDQATELKEKLATDREEAQRILAEVRQVAAEHGVSQQAKYFRDEAEEHSTAAGKWQGYTVKIAIGLGLFAALSVFLHKLPWIKPENTYETIQLGISKVLIFGVIAYMLVLAARNFLSHKHNEIVNKHRQNALLTFNALVDAAKGEDKRDIVLTHAAACIFSPQDTGYTKAAGGQDQAPTKIIEILPKMGSATPG